MSAQFWALRQEMMALVKHNEGLTAKYADLTAYNNELLSLVSRSMRERVSLLGEVTFWRHRAEGCPTPDCDCAKQMWGTTPSSEAVGSDIVWSMRVAEAMTDSTTRHQTAEH